MTNTQKSKPLVAIHLSDIHFGQEKGEAVEINGDARDQLVLKVGQIAQAREAAGQPPIGGIIITGDIAYSGKKEQFDAAAEWLRRLSEAAKCNPLSVQVVPGNHDVDRGDSLMLNGLLDNLLNLGREFLNRVLGHAGDCSALYGRFEAYQEFANGYGCKLDTKGGNAGMKEHSFVPGKTLRLLGLNSALLCCGKETAKEPRLLLGARQRIIKEAPDVEYAILVHHPMRWLEDGSDTWKYIDNRARILMCGHEHNSNVDLRPTESGRQVLVIDAGATVPDEVTPQFTYTFNVIEIDLSRSGEAIDVTVDTYKWQENALRFEQDTANHVKGRPQTYTLPCPNFVARATQATTASEAAEEAEAVDDAGTEPEATIEAIDLSSVSAGSEKEVLSFAQARKDFFHALTIAQRLTVLVHLRALPENATQYSQGIMLRQLNRLNRAGRLQELTAAIAEAKKAG